MYIGIDIGGTNIKAGLVDARGRIRKRIVVPTEKKSLERLTEILKDIISELGRGAKVQGVGFSVPGFFNRYAMHHSNIKILDNVNLKKLLGIKVPVRLENDARCFVLAEWRNGAAKGTKNVVGLTLGTFIGSGFILNGQLYSGAEGRAGETSWTTMNPLEVAGKNAKPISWKVGGEFFLKIYKRKGGKSKSVREMWNERSRAAIGTRKEAGIHLAIYVLNMIKIFDPEIVVLGGGISTATTLRDIKKYLKLYAKDWKCIPKIVLSKYGPFGSVAGAAMLFR